MMVCSLPQNYSSPIDYQYYLVVTLKCRCNQPGGTTTPPHPNHGTQETTTKKTPPPKKKEKKTPRTRDRTKGRPPPPQKKNPPQKKKKKKKKRTRRKKKRELSLRILPRRKRLLTSLHRERLVRRGLQQQYFMRFSNFVKFMYARIIK